MFSERINPWMALVKSTADTLRETRQPLPDDDPAIVTEHALMAQTGEALGVWRRGRDAWVKQCFEAIYGHPLLARAFAAGEEPANQSKKE